MINERLNTEEVLRKFAKRVYSRSRANLTRLGKGGGPLYDSLVFKDEDLKVHKQSFSLEMKMEKHGEFQDLGVRGIGGVRKTGKNKGRAYENKGAGGKFQFRKGVPSREMIKSLKSWIRTKGLKGRDQTTGRFITNQSLSFILAKSIFHTGIKPSLFFTKPFESAFKDLPPELEEAYALDVEAMIEQTLNTD